MLFAANIAVEQEAMVAAITIARLIGLLYLHTSNLHQQH